MTYFFEHSDNLSILEFDGNTLSSVINVPCKDTDYCSILREKGYMETTVENILNRMEINQLFETYHSFFLKTTGSDYKKISKKELYAGFIGKIISEIDCIQQTEKYMPMLDKQKNRLRCLLYDLISLSRSISDEISLPIFAHIGYISFERQINPQTEVKIKTNCGVWKEAMSELKKCCPFNGEYEFGFCYSSFVQQIITL